MEKNIKYGVIIPLIGGFTVAAKQKLKRVPEFILSYPDMKANDNQYFYNYPNEKNNYILLEDYTNKFLDKNDEEKFNKLNKNIDIMISTPLCSGLSMLNCGGGKDSSKGRGSDAVQNRFMYLTSNFVLTHIKPKVFVFENAPGMYTKSGEGVFNNLVEIAKKYGYSFSAIKTSTIKHGIPQNRSRSFGFFWKSEYAPIIEYYDRPFLPLDEYLKLIPEGIVHHDKQKFTEKFNDNVMVKYMVYKEGPDFNTKLADKYITIMDYIASKKLYDEASEFFDKYDDPTAKRMTLHAKKKHAMGMGIWDATPTLHTDRVNGVISKNMMRFLHPKEQRFLTYRECMWLMGLPHTFNINNGKIFTITQNVPVNTAEDMLEQCIKFINGELPFSSSKVLKQNNMNKRIDYPRKNSIKNSFARLL